MDIGLSDEQDKSLRPADMLLYSWDGGKDGYCTRGTGEKMCVDITGSSPLT